MSHTGLTIKAAQKVYALMQEEANLELKLRVYIQGGGCSGFQYGFSFETEIAEDDAILPTQWWSESRDLAEDRVRHIEDAYRQLSHCLSPSWDRSYTYLCAAMEQIVAAILRDADAKQHSVSLLVDAISYQYLAGATIDYKTGVEGEFFAVDNPNAKTTCGCGSSFSV
jgi:iron-sulfur cluster insertion protein